MKAFWIIACILFAILIFTSFHLSIFKSSPITSIQVGETVLDKIEIADSVRERELGLSGRNSIENNFGLLFVFESLGRHGFWMKDMNFPIDIIWLDQNFTIVGLQENADPSSYPQVFYPASPASYVLETKVGLIQKETLITGEKIIIK